jgi:hypothetical protein
MKIFNCYTLICALALTETTFAANVNSSLSRANQIGEYLSFSGLKESDDLNWFKTRMSLKNDPFLRKTLIADVQHPTRFTANRGTLAKYCLEQPVSDEDYAGLVRVLIESKYYASIIDLIKTDATNFLNLVDVPEDSCDAIYRIIKRNKDSRSDFYESLSFVPQSNRLNIRIYANSILDPEIPEKWYIEGISTKGEMLFEILFDVIKNAKTSEYKQEIYWRAMNVLNKCSHDYPGADAARMALNMLVVPGKVTMEALGITSRCLQNNFTYKFLISAAYALNKNLLIDEMISSLSHSQMRLNFVESLLKGTQYYSGDQYVAFVLRIFGKLSDEAQQALLDERWATPFFNFLLKNFKIYFTVKKQQNLKITFSTDNEYLVNNNLNYRFDYLVEIPGTLEQLMEWFSNARFASATAFTDFINGISKSTAFKSLKERHIPVSINIDTFILIATNQDLIDNLKTSAIFVKIIDNDLKNVHKLLENDHLLDIHSIIDNDTMKKCIAPAIISDRMLKNFEKLCGKGIVMDILNLNSCRTKAEDYLGIRNVILCAMNDRIYRNYLTSVQSPNVQQMLAKDFPELLVTDSNSNENTNNGNMGMP